MRIKLQVFCALLAVATMLSLPVRAETYTIPFSDIQQIIDTSGDAPDVVIRAYLAGLIRDELDALGFATNGGLVLNAIPLDEMTVVIEDNCNFPQPFEIHTDATTATVSLGGGSGLTVDLDSIRSVALHADLEGSVSAQADAWVRWGQDIIFIGNCVKFETDHGWVGLTLPFDIGLDLTLDLNPYYDSELIAIVVDKHATLSGQAQISGGTLQHDFGSFSLTDVLIDIFEDRMLDELQSSGETAVAEAIADLNLRLDGLDEDGLPDPTIEAFNAPTVFALEIDEEDKAFVRDLLAQLGVPEFLIEMLDERGIEILLQLAVLDAAEREVYLAELGADASCDVLLAAFETPLDVTPLYTPNGSLCEVADTTGPDAGTYFTDMQCTQAVAFTPTDVAEFCQARFGDAAETLLGNASAWTADTNQPNDVLPGVASLPWTTTPSTQLDLGAISLQGNHQPYMKQLNYKTVLDVQRGSGTCELEMRVYKKDITEQNLKPLMAIHGGTWRHRGDSFSGLEAGISHLTERGFIVFAPFYRLTGQSDGNTECNRVSWRELTDDVEDALDWINENGATLGATDEPVSVYGQSAGAHLAAWLAAYRPDDVQKALLFYPPIDVLNFLSGAVPAGGPFEEYRDFGLTSLSRLYGAEYGAAEVRIADIDFSAATVATLQQDWSTLIPDSVFNLGLVDTSEPPIYLARCADATQTDLSVISLIAPPAELIACLKQDLSEFLIDNSLAHVLGDDAVPIHVVQGTADSLVPYQQALHLCEAIDDRVLPTAVTDPLTVYDCGTASRIQLVRDAEHALELGLCFDSICPSGEFGSVTRAAVTTAINDAYLWLLADLPIAGPSGVSVISLPDVNLNGVPDIAVFREDTFLVEIRDGQAGALINSTSFFGEGYAPVSVAALPDSDGNGVAEVAVLATRVSDGRIVAELRNVVGVEAPRLVWFAANHTPVAIKAIDSDADGNGVAELAVLSTRNSDDRIVVEVKNAFGATNPNTVWFMAGNTPADLEIIPDKDANGVPEIAVLSTRNSDGRIVTEVKNAAGVTAPTTVWFMPGHTAIDIVAVDDKDANGIPEVAVLSSRNSDGRNVVEVKNASGPAAPTAVWFMAGTTATEVAHIEDADNNGVPDVAVLSVKDSDGRVLVEVKNVIGATSPNTMWYSPGFAARGLAILGDTDNNGVEEALVLMIRDSDGRILVQGRNVAGGPAPTDYWFSP